MLAKKNLAYAQFNNPKNLINSDTYASQKAQEGAFA
jgi:hypothetical protein